jgi:hypothetical protein
VVAKGKKNKESEWIEEEQNNTYDLSSHLFSAHFGDLGLPEEPRRHLSFAGSRRLRIVGQRQHHCQHDADGGGGIEARC